MARSASRNASSRSPPVCCFRRPDWPLLAGARSGVYVAGLSALVAADLLYQWRSHYRRLPGIAPLPGDPPGAIPARAAASLPRRGRRERALSQHQRLRRRRGHPYARRRRAPRLRRLSGRHRRLPARRLLQEARQPRRAGSRLPERALPRRGEGRASPLARQPLDADLLGRGRRRLRERLGPAAGVRSRACPPRRELGEGIRAARRRQCRLRSGVRGDRRKPRLPGDGLDPGPERDGEAPGGEASITNYRETTNAVDFDAACRVRGRLDRALDRSGRRLVGGRRRGRRPSALPRERPVSRPPSARRKHPRPPALLASGFRSRRRDLRHHSRDSRGACRASPPPSRRLA